MSKPVRLADYLYAQIEELAVAEKRSLANMVQVLLEQALKAEEGNRKLGRIADAVRDHPEQAKKTIDDATAHFKPDPK